MKRKDFISLLYDRDIMYEIKDDVVVISKENGSVYLRGLHRKTIKYQGKDLLIHYVDSSTMIITSSRSKDDFTIHKAKYFKGGDIDKLPSCFIAQRGEFYAHGKNINQAISDCNFKFLQENANLDDIVKSVKEKQTMSREDYRLLTGACSYGVAQFCKDNNISDETKELPLSEVVKLTANYYGGEKIQDLFKV